MKMLPVESLLNLVKSLGNINKNKPLLPVGADSAKEDKMRCGQ